MEIKKCPVASLRVEEDGCQAQEYLRCTVCGARGDNAECLLSEAVVTQKVTEKTRDAHANAIAYAAAQEYARVLVAMLVRVERHKRRKRAEYDPVSIFILGAMAGTLFTYFAWYYKW